MGAVTVLGIIALVAGVLLAVLSLLPGEAQGGPEAQPETANMEEVGKKFNSVYTNVLDDLTSYIENPDYERAADSQAKIVDRAGQAAGQFRTLAEELQQKADSITPEPDPGTPGQNPAAGSTAP